MANGERYNTILGLFLGPTEVVSCTYHHWYKPSSKHHYQLPVFGRRVQRCPQIRLESHSLAIVHVVGRFANGHHVARADRVCMHCGALHMLLLQMSYMLLWQMSCRRVAGLSRF